jgi:hypothetical protein
LFRRSVRSKCIRHAASSLCGKHEDVVPEGGGNGSKSLLFLNYGHYVLGSGGTGKSHLAQAIGQSVIQQGYKVLYRETHILLEEIADATLDGARKQYIESVSTVALLIID